MLNPQLSEVLPLGYPPHAHTTRVRESVGRGFATPASFEGAKDVPTQRKELPSVNHTIHPAESEDSARPSTSQAGKHYAVGCLLSGVLRLLEVRRDGLTVKKLI